jgi:hypothetical protein
MRILLGLLFILPSFKVWAVLGGDIPSTTPAGTVIDRGRLSIDNKGKEIEIDINIFYFYKKHLIGKTVASQYFIYNEKSKQIQVFNQENNWQKAIQKQNLKPKIWTRWHQGNWSNGGDWFVIFFIYTIMTFGLPLLFIGVFLFFMYRLAKTIFESDEVLPKVMYVLSIVLMTLLILLPFNPQSI